MNNIVKYLPVILQISAAIDMILGKNNVGETTPVELRPTIKGHGFTITITRRS